MPSERPVPGSARDWILRAKSDLAIARAPLPEGAFYEDLCYHAQQAAEKAIKAVYRHHGWRFHYVHDLDELLTGLAKAGLEIPSDVAACVALNSYGSGIRYPGPDEPVTEAEYRHSLQMSEIVVNWAEASIK